MDIPQYMKDNIKTVRDIIDELGNEFSSHDFIQNFAKENEEIYITMLWDVKKKGAFREVHAKIARFLSENSDILEIEKDDKKYSTNVFGYEDKIQGWRRV